MLKFIPIVPRHVTSLLSDGITRVFPTVIRVGQLQHPCWGSTPVHTVVSPTDSLTARLPAIIVILVAAKVIWWLHQDLLLSVNYQSFHCSYHHCQYNKRSHTRGPGLQSPHFKWLQSAILGLDCTTPISYYRSLSPSLSLSLSDIQIILANICYWE